MRMLGHAMCLACLCRVRACSATNGPSTAVDGIVRYAIRAQYAKSTNPTQFLDPWVALTIVLDKQTPNIAVVKLWQSDNDNAAGVTTNISVWLHTYGVPSSAALPPGHQRAFLSGVLCTSGMWPTMGIASTASSRTGRCNQTIGSPGAKYVTFQKFSNWVTYSSVGSFYVAEVQILADGASLHCMLVGFAILGACTVHGRTRQTMCVHSFQLCRV